MSSMARFYATSEPAESGLLQPGHVPRELIQHVHQNKLSKAGASGKSARLHTSTKEGVKEAQALQSFQYASNSIR